MLGLIDIEVTTRLSYECCRMLVETNLVAKMYSLMLSCNRSAPHKEVLRNAIKIVANLVLHDEIVEDVYHGHDGSILVLVDISCSHREDAPIRTQCLKIVHALLKRYSNIIEPREKEVFRKKLSSMSTLLARKPDPKTKSAVSYIQSITALLE